LTQPRSPALHASIGWREWVALPDLKIERIKAKVDTGARSSCLHAFDVQILLRPPTPVVLFKVHARKGDGAPAIECEAPLLDQRWVRSSNGKREFRPVIRTLVSLDGDSWPIDLTLTARDSMGFRMLLGREAIRKRFVVDPSVSFVVRALVPPRSPHKKKPLPPRAE
jgi:hypothetical protein